MTQATYQLSEKAEVRHVNHTWALFVSGELHRPLGVLEEVLVERLIEADQTPTDTINAYMESLR